MSTGEVTLTFRAIDATQVAKLLATFTTGHSGRITQWDGEPVRIENLHLASPAAGRRGFISRLVSRVIRKVSE